MSTESNLPEGYVLGVDLGLKNIGIAASQTVTGHAHGLCTIRAKKGEPINWPSLKALIAEYQPITIVVGLPLNMDGTESAMAERARKFAQTLAQRTGYPTVMSDERLSSWSSSKADGADLHQESACRIVETWLREQQQNR